MLFLLTNIIHIQVISNYLGNHAWLKVLSTGLPCFIAIYDKGLPKARQRLD